MLTVYVLSMYTCVTVNDFSGSLMSKSCNWHPNGALYATEDACKNAGKSQVGHPFYSDIADGAVHEDYRCYAQSVTQ
jgi:hypothetical protein